MGNEVYRRAAFFWILLKKAESGSVYTVFAVKVLWFQKYEIKKYAAVRYRFPFCKICFSLW